MYDAIVLGVGGMGSAALYHLACSGCKVLGLEQYGVPHAFGSSHGSTRIIRLAYSEGNEYVPLLLAAYRYWRELEVISGQSILHVTGGLDIGTEGSWTIRGSRDSCVRHRLDFEHLDGTEVNRRFPGYRLPPSMQAIYQPDGGYLLSETAIAAYVGAARWRGADLLTDTSVLNWERTETGLRVRTSLGDYEAKRMVITAGAWIGRLAPAMGKYCRPERQVMLWTEPLDLISFEASRFPVFNMEAPFGRFYGVPNHDSEGFKIGKYHHLRQEVREPSELDRSCHPEDETALREAIKEFFPRANGPAKMAAACMFTNSPDGDFILDRHPEEDRVFVAAGFSGHGFKFCSVVGKLMAELCLDYTPSWDICRFRLTHDRVKSWHLGGTP